MTFLPRVRAKRGFVVLANGAGTNWRQSYLGVRAEQPLKA
jgi:hypothetical protein